MPEGQHQINIILELDDSKFTGKIKLSGTLAEEFVKKVSPAAKDATGSVNDLTRRLREAQNEFNRLAPTSAKYATALRRVQNLQNLLSKTTRGAMTNMAKFGGVTGTTGFAVLNMNRVISDMPFGMIAISNNIEPLVQSFVSLKNEAGGTRAALLTLGKSMIGPLGLMTAVSLVTAVITKFAMANRSSKTAAKNNKKEIDELNTRIRTLAASYDDLITAEKNYRSEILKSDMREQEKLIAILQRKIEKGGIVVKGEFHAFEPEEIKRFKSEIDAAKKKINEYKKSLDEGSPLIQKNIELLKGLAEAAGKDGVKGIEKFAKANKLSEKQLGNLLNQLKSIKSDLYSIAGGLAKELEPGQREFAIKLGMQRDELTKTIKVLSDYYDALTGKKKEKKKIEFDLSDVETKGFELTKLQKEMIDRARKIFEDNGYIWTPERHAYVLKIVFEATASKKKKTEEEANKEIESFGKRIKDSLGLGVKVDKDGYMLPIGLKFQKPEPNLKVMAKDLIPLRMKAELLTTTFNTLGVTMVDAFMGTKVALGEVLSQLESMILKTLVLAGIKAGLSATFPLLAPFFSEGGVSDQPRHFQFVNPKVFKGAPHFAEGGIAGIPAILHKREMVLTERDQLNLWNTIRSLKDGRGAGGTIIVEPVFRNVIEGQKIITEGIKQRQAIRR